MYEVLGGKPAFSAKFGMEYMNKHVTETPQSLTKYNQELKLPEELERIILRCMQKAPENRYQTINQCIADLKKLKEGMKVAVALPEQEKVQRNKYAKVGALALAFLGLFAAVTYRDPIGKLLFPPIPEESTPSQSKIPTEPMPIHIGLPVRPEKYQEKNLSQWTQLIEDNPEDAKAYYGRGMLHLYRREYSEANRDFDKVTQLDPKFADVYVERSILRTANCQNGEYDKTLADANMAIELSPKSSRGYFARGYVYETSEQNQLAIADGEKAVTLGETGSEYEPAYLNVFEFLSTAYMNMGRYDDADKTIELGLKKVSPRFTWLMYRQKALLYCFKQDFPKALETIELAIKRDNCGPSGWMTKAYCLASIGKIEDAQKVALSSQNKQTGPPEAYRGRGEFWRLCGMPEQAILDFGKAIWLEQSKNYYSYRLRANCYIEQGNLHDALSDLQDAVSMNPRSARCKAMLAMVESRLGKTARARKHIEEAFTMPTRPPILYVYKASVELDAGELDKAMSDLNEAIKRDPYLKEAYALRKDVNEKLRRVKEAMDDLAISKKLAAHPQMLP
jgi:tetratricopeptide (TPR) repeat protein